MLQLVRTYTQLAVEVVRWMEKQTTITCQQLELKLLLKLLLLLLLPVICLHSLRLVHVFFSIFSSFWLLPLLLLLAVVSHQDLTKRYDSKPKNSFSSFSRSAAFLSSVQQADARQAGCLTLLISTLSLPFLLSTLVPSDFFSHFSSNGQIFLRTSLVGVYVYVRTIA